MLLAPPTLPIEPLTAADTWALRQAVLWPDQPLAYVQLPDDAAGQHFGVRAPATAEVVAVISLFDATPGAAARFRKFATHPAWQRRGLGTALLGHVLAVARRQGARCLWCDARLDTLGFYRRFGLAPVGEVFYKGPQPYQRLEVSLC